MSSPIAGPKSGSLVPTALILAATLVAYLPVLGNGFVNFDDPYFITDNPNIRELSWQSLRTAFTAQLWTPYYKPLVYLSWTLEYHLFGARPLVYHLDNLLLHLLNSVLVFVLVRRLTPLLGLPESFRHGPAFLVALLFGLHPLHVESVAWATARKDVLFALFFLLATLTYLVYVRRAPRARPALAVTAVCYLAAVLTKSMAISFVAMPYLIDRFAGRRLSARTALLEKLPILVVAAGAAVLYGLGHQAGAGGGAIPLHPLEINFRLLGFFAHTVLPLHLSVAYPRAELLAALGAAIWLLPLVTALLVYLAGRTGRRHPVVLFGALFYLVTISAALVAPATGTNFLADRYTYLPSIGVLLLIVYATMRVAGDQRARLASIALIVIGLIWGAQTYVRCQVWNDSVALWTDAITKFPGRIGVAYVNRGNAYRERGDFALALRDYDQALETNPRISAAYHNRAALFVRTGQLERALDDFDRALEMDPDFSPSLLYRGMLLTKLRRFEPAERDYDRYLRLVDDDPKAFLWRGLTRQAKGHHQAAIQDLTRAVELDPNPWRPLRARARSYAALGLQDQAAEDSRRAQVLQSADPGE